LVLTVAALPAAAQETATFDYYLLALSWSPQYCADRHGEAAADAQCGGQRKYGFVLHGLWPQNEDGGYPSMCRSAPGLPSRLIERLLPIMPSERLIQHEWAKHGTCTGLSADDYADESGLAFRKVQIPEPLKSPHAAVSATVQRVKQLFAEANPGLTAGMMSVICAGRDRAISEIHLCLTKSLDFRRCGSGQVDTCRDNEGRFRPIP
jgi:ribonuclease T2